jgi:response regulator RpfG family c-di-GMP phosphodiesterase
LAIDDEKMNTEFYFGLLEYKGYNVLKTENGEDALDILKSVSIDLVLSDVVMPEIIELADTVSEVQEVKYHYNKGIKDRASLEY